MKNYLMSSLAIVGAISLIIMACSADNSKNSNSTNSTNAVGKYQIAARGNFIDVLDTETGVVKTYKDNATGAFQATGTLLLYSTTITQ
jgi:hypothetical protein